ncbi:MAG: glutathione S-transferase family protein [Pseudomonadales bacterium]
MIQFPVELLDSLLTLTDTGFLVGKGPTQTDVALWDALDPIVTRLDGTGFRGFAHIAEFYERISELPGISDYFESDRRLPVGRIEPSI